MATLYLIPTPLSQEAPEQALPPYLANTAAALSHFLVENPRTARRFLSQIGLKGKLEERHFYTLNKHTQEKEMPELMLPLMQGNDMGLLSEAGAPGLADPGALAVRYAGQLGARVVPLVGPSSILMALMASGMNGQHFTFHGYLPIARRERKTALKKLEQTSVREGSAQLFMETPYRNRALLQDILNTCSPSTWLCIARDLTGTHEWVGTHSVGEWKKLKVNLHKIPCIFILQAGDLGVPETFCFS